MYSAIDWVLDFLFGFWFQEKNKYLDMLSKYEK